jgi:putative membrane protein
MGCSLLVSWLILSLAVWLTSLILPGFRVTGFWGAIKTAALFGLLNVTIGWLIFTVLGLATFGIGFVLAFLTRWITNALLLKIVDGLSESVKIDSFARAFVAGLLISGIGSVFSLLACSVT